LTTRHWQINQQKSEGVLLIKLRTYPRLGWAAGGISLAGATRVSARYGWWQSGHLMG
jgi:hypothetical protein